MSKVTKPSEGKADNSPKDGFLGWISGTLCGIDKSATTIAKITDSIDNIYITKLINKTRKMSPY
jgi:hypothetical protein